MYALGFLIPRTYSAARGRQRGLLGGHFGPRCLSLFPPGLVVVAAAGMCGPWWVPGRLCGLGPQGPARMPRLRMQEQERRRRHGRGRCSRFSDLAPRMGRRSNRTKRCAPGEARRGTRREVTTDKSPTSYSPAMRRSLPIDSATMTYWLSEADTRPVAAKQFIEQGRDEEAEVQLEKALAFYRSVGVRVRRRSRGAPECRLTMNVVPRYRPEPTVEPLCDGIFRAASVFSKAKATIKEGHPCHSRAEPVGSQPRWLSRPS